MRGIKKRGVILLLCCIILISTLSISFAASFASAADVAYIYNKDFKIDKNVIGVFNDLGLSVDTIKASQVSSVDLSQYRLILMLFLVREALLQFLIIILTIIIKLRVLKK